MNNLLLAIITQEFSLAVIRSLKTLKQSILIVQGVIVCLYVIQFTRYSRSLRSPAANFDILAHSAKFVKMFFTNFQTLFCALCCPPPQGLHQTACRLYHFETHLSRPFFDLFPVSSVVTYSFAALSQALGYTSRSGQKSQALFS